MDTAQQAVEFDDRCALSSGSDAANWFFAQSRAADEPGRQDDREESQQAGRGASGRRMDWRRRTPRESEDIVWSKE